MRRNDWSPSPECALADGRLASASWEDGMIRLWDLGSGAETARLEGHTDVVRTLAPLADGRLASAFDDNTIRLWDLDSGVETARLEGHTGLVSALAVLADGRLASGSGSPLDSDNLLDPDTTIRLWDVGSGAETARLEGHTEEVGALAMLPDGRLASASQDKTIRLWDVGSGAETARLEGHTEGVGALAMLPDGRLVSGSWDKTIRLWDLGSGKEIACLEVDAPIYCLAALPGRRLIAGDQLGRLHWLQIVD